MYFVNGRYVSAEEARRLRGLDKSKKAEPAEAEEGTPEEAGYAEPQLVAPKKTKKEIVAELKANGIDFNPNAKKEELEALLQAAPAVEPETDAEADAGEANV